MFHQRRIHKNNFHIKPSETQPIYYKYVTCLQTKAETRAERSGKRQPRAIERLSEGRRGRTQRNKIHLRNLEFHSPGEPNRVAIFQIQEYQPHRQQGILHPARLLKAKSRGQAQGQAEERSQVLCNRLAADRHLVPAGLRKVRSKLRGEQLQASHAFQSNQQKR